MVWEKADSEKMYCYLESMLFLIVCISVNLFTMMIGFLAFFQISCFWQYELALFLSSNLKRTDWALRLSEEWDLQARYPMTWKLFFLPVAQSYHIMSIQQTSCHCQYHHASARYHWFLCLNWRIWKLEHPQSSSESSFSCYLIVLFFFASIISNLIFSRGTLLQG